MSGDIQHLLGMSSAECCWFLVGLTDGQMTHYDGCWSSLKEVEEALYLRERIQTRRQPDRWIAVHIVQGIGPRPYDVNEQAITSCNDMLNSYLDRPHRRRGGERRSSAVGGYRLPAPAL